MNRLHAAPQSAKAARQDSLSAPRPPRAQPRVARRRPRRSDFMDRASLERIPTSELWGHFRVGAGSQSLEDLRRIRDVLHRRYFSLIPSSGQRALAS